jgi:hypothetical protein
MIIISTHSTKKLQEAASCGFLTSTISFDYQYLSIATHLLQLYNVAIRTHTSARIMMSTKQLLRSAGLPGRGSLLSGDCLSRPMRTPRPQVRLQIASMDHHWQRRPWQENGKLASSTVAALREHYRISTAALNRAEVRG